LWRAAKASGFFPSLIFSQTSFDPFCSSPRLTLWKRKHRFKDMKMTYHLVIKPLVTTFILAAYYAGMFNGSF